MPNGVEAFGFRKKQQYFWMHKFAVINLKFNQMDLEEVKFLQKMQLERQTVCP